MSDLVAKQNSSVPAVQAQQEVLRGDLIVPYIVLGQGTSDAVKDRAVQLGDIYRSTSKEVLGNPDKPVEAVFLHAPVADWVNEEKPKGANRFEFRKSVPRTAANENLPWSYYCDSDGNEFKPDGTAYTAQDKGVTEWRRVKRLVVYAILPADIEAERAEMEKAKNGGLPDPNKALTPVAFSFRSNSFRAGREVATFFAKSKKMIQPIYNYRLPCSCKLTQNDQGSFYIWTVDLNNAKGVHPSDRGEIEYWAKLVGGGASFQTHEEGEASAYSEPTAPTSESEVC